MPGAVCFEHVDDLSHILTSKSRTELYHKAIEVGEAVDKGIRELDLQLANKSVATTNATIGHIIVKQLASKGIEIKIAKSADDVGIETAVGTRRCVASQNKRIAKASSRAKRNGKLAKINAGAHKLGPTGTHPQQSYGHVVQGASRSQTYKMRRNMKLGTNMGGTNSCITSTLAWFYGPRGDPAISLKLDQIAAWIDKWVSYDDRTKARTRNIWKRALPRLGLNQESMWSHAKGPISGTICAVLEIGWKPLAPDRWLAGDLMAIIDGAGFCKAHILGQAQKDISKHLWREASKHKNSSGLEDGGILQPAKAAKKSLIKEGNYAAAKAVDFLICGAIHDPEPKEDGHYKNEHLCQRCESRLPASRKHELWECPANDNIEHPHIAKSKWTVRGALVGWEKWQGLYARGILPEAWNQRPPDIDFLEAKVWVSDNFVDTLHKTGFACSDGAGGPKDVPKTITQVGFGAVSFDFVPINATDFELHDLACIGGQVPANRRCPDPNCGGESRPLSGPTPALMSTSA